MRAALLISALLAAASVHAEDLRVREVGSYHVGGKEVVLSGLPTQEISFTAGMAPVKVDPNGQFEAFRCMCNTSASPSPGALPAAALAWRRLAGVTWETKPDGSPGWQSSSSRQGHDVYVSDAVERGRASWARYPRSSRARRSSGPSRKPGSCSASARSAPGQQEAFPGTQFPTDAFDQFAKQGVPRFATSDGRPQEAYDAYVQKACPCVILVHSQGGNFAFTAALHAPDKIKAMIAVEPSGAPPANTDVSALKGVPHLFIWGDHPNDHPLWPRFQAAVAAYRDALGKAGAVAIGSRCRIAA